MCGSGNNLEEIAHFLTPFVKNYDEYSEGCYEKFLIGSEKVLDFFNTQISTLDKWSETAINEVIDRAKRVRFTNAKNWYALACCIAW